SSQTNRDDTTVAGTVFELKKADPTQTVKLTLDFDKDGIKKKVQEYLDAYNQLIKFIDEKSKVEVKQAESASPNGPKGKAQIVKGPFAGDSTILGLRAQLQGLMTNQIPELADMNLGRFSSLASMGITSEQKTGFLTINDTAFNAALDQDFEGIKRVFITAGYATNPAHTFGTYSKDTKTGGYDIDPATAGIDTDKSKSGLSWAAATVDGDGNIFSSTTGDSAGMSIQAAAGSGAGKLTFVRGVAGQVQDFYEKING